MTEVWYCNQSNISKAQFEHYLSFFPPVMQEEVLRYRFFKDQLARLMARLIIYKATGYTNELFHTWQRLPNNKPVITNWKPFSISHSGDYIVVAIGDALPIGIDIEELRENTDVIALADYFCSVEKAAILASETPKYTFFELWTKKEALLKALGDGLIKDGLSQFDCRGNSVIAKGKTWHLTPIKIATGYSCYLATTVKNELVSIKEVSPADFNILQKNS
jgi:4'-phosphopantetheinyl transferase